MKDIASKWTSEFTKSKWVLAAIFVVLNLGYQWMNNRFSNIDWNVGIFGIATVVLILSIPSKWIVFTRGYEKALEKEKTQELETK